MPRMAGRNAAGFSRVYRPLARDKVERLKEKAGIERYHVLYLSYVQEWNQMSKSKTWVTEWQEATRPFICGLCDKVIATGFKFTTIEFSDGWKKPVHKGCYVRFVKSRTFS